jgi:hypothetical protein
MEPVPESARLLDQLGGLDHGLPGIATLGQQIQDLVPSCVGLSLTILEDEITFTLVSSSTPIASLDALQYLDGGPCPGSIRDGGFSTGPTHASCKRVRGSCSVQESRHSASRAPCRCRWATTG